MQKQTWISNFEPFADKILDKYKVPGTAIAVSKDGEALYQRGIGYRNLEKKLTVTEDTIFGIASITKSFTAIAIMQLQEAGKLSVEDRVITYLPEFNISRKEQADKITIHHFLTHTSGLPTLPSLYFAMKRSMENDPSVTDKQQARLKEHDPIDHYHHLIAFISELEFDLLGEPGTEFSYSNDAYALLGAIIERVSGLPYDEYVTEYILKPAGMTSSTFDLDRVINSEHVTTIYASKEEEEEKEIYEAENWWDSRAMLAGGFLRSTQKDMMRYTELFLNDGKVGEQRILTPESVKEMTHPHFQFLEGKYYGYGLMITPDYNGGTLVEHGGSLKGVSSHMSIVPEKGLAGIVLTNLVGVPVSPLLLGALNSIQGLTPETPLQTYRDFSVNSNDLIRYIGKYTSGEFAEMEISMESDQLSFTTEGKTYPMRPVGKDLFTMEMNETEVPIRFLFDHHGENDRLFIGVRQLLKENSEEKAESV
ncbi:serine hydrolase domain-containing protein [Alteribacter populi]|uniref:serine hydrolase domain-containing protein n=1 Tax=Alteribacter populi TaxID=2011011 RepID=UPI000BBB0173|nr:serine hydrolase domain-containing protein [Alteribacter populi]